MALGVPWPALRYFRLGRNVREGDTHSTLIVGLNSVGMGYDLTLDPEMFVLTHARAASQHRDYHLIGAVDPDNLRRKTFEDEYYHLARERAFDSTGLRPGTRIDGCGCGYECKEECETWDTTYLGFIST